MKSKPKPLIITIACDDSVARMLGLQCQLNNNLNHGFRKSPLVLNFLTLERGIISVPFVPQCNCADEMRQQLLELFLRYFTNVRGYLKLENKTFGYKETFLSRAIRHMDSLIAANQSMCLLTFYSLVAMEMSAVTPI